MDPSFAQDSLHLRSMPGSLEELAQLQQPLVVPQVSVSGPVQQMENIQQPLKIPQLTLSRSTNIVDQFSPEAQTFRNAFAADVHELQNPAVSQASDNVHLFSDEENMLTIPLYDTFQNQSPTGSIVESVIDTSKSQLVGTSQKGNEEMLRTVCKSTDSADGCKSKFTVLSETSGAFIESNVAESAEENDSQYCVKSEAVCETFNDKQIESGGEPPPTVDFGEESENDLFKFLEKEKQEAVSESSIEQQTDVSKSKVHTSPLEKSVSDTDMLRLVQDRLDEEKHMFSENLGLIPKESGEKIMMKTRSESKQMRTRGKTNAKYKDINDDVNITPITGHQHVRGLYKCGGCSKIFTKICKLHEHLNDHTEGGSYHYDHILRTAFPKLGTVCAKTQTGSDFENNVNENNVKIKTVKRAKPFGRGIQFKKPTVKGLKERFKTVEPDASTDGIKKRRGRPKKAKRLSLNKKKVSKIKVKTEDGGTTWKGVSDDDADMAVDETEKETDVDEDMLESASVTLDREPEDSNEATEMLVDMCMKDIESDLASIIGSPPESTKERKTHKRKMTVPRKILHAPTEDDEKTFVKDSESSKIVNSRAKPAKKIKCDLCDSKFQYTRGLIRHEQEMHEEDMKFQCDVCPQKFMREYNLKRHKLCSHTVGKVKFIRKKRPGGSIMKVKKKPGRKPRDTSAAPPVQCEVCEKMVPASKVEIHKRIHTGDRPCICHICGKGLISDKKLKRHLLIHSETRRHTCDVCGEGFSMKYKLRTHMFIHTGHKPYLCSACGAEFNNSTSLLHHHRTVHLGDKRFECTICGGRYGKKSQLEEHMFSHSSERTQTCRYCGKTFKHAKSLRRHESTHVTDKKYPCDQCDSKFSRKDNLERHKMGHYELALQCSFCKKKFRDKKPLLEHEQFHINQRRYQCQLCKDKFQDEAYFYNHMEKNHQLTKDMVPVINALASNSESSKGDKHKDNLDISSHDIGIQNAGSLSDQQLLPLSGQVQDTLNLSMNVAGIIPVSNQEVIPVSSHSILQNVLTQQNTVVNQIYIPSQNQMNGSRNVLNQPAASRFTSANQILPSGIVDNQRASLSVMESLNPTESVGMRITIDQQTGTLSMTTSDNLMVHEQQRLMQEALGSSLGVQTPGYRMQNLY